MKIRFSILTFAFCLLLLSCAGKQQKRYEKEILEWSKKTIIFPDSMRSIFGEDIQAPNSEFTIVAYFDSVGCTSCRMKLPEWCKIMTKVDSIMGNNQVSLLLVTGSHELADLRNMVKREAFPYTILNDSSGIFAQLNSIPDDTRLQTFLLDNNHKVYLIGNPTHSLEMRKLYLDHFAFISDKVYSSGEESIEEFDFGPIKINELAHHDFRLKNIYPDTLHLKEILSSCECTTAEVSSRKIAPGDYYDVVVSFRDSVPGEFIRSVTVKYQDSIPDQILEITGKIVR